MGTNNALLEMINMIVTGGLLGVGGQSIRAILGLLKQKNRRISDFILLRLILNLLVGFALGGLASSLLIQSGILDFTFQTMFMLFAIGYAGGDIIERIVKLCAQRNAIEKAPISRTSLMWNVGRFSDKGPFDES